MRSAAADVLIGVSPRASAYSSPPPSPQRLPALTATECGAYTPMDADAVPEADQTGLYMVAGLYVFDSMKTPLYAGLQAMMARNRMLDVSKNTVYDMLMTAIRQAYVYDSRQTKPDAADPTADR